MRTALACLAAVLVATLSGCSGPGLAPPGCDALTLDLRRGTLNGLAPTASMDEVKAQFPCFTGESPEGDPVMNYGGGVFFLDHSFFAYTFRDYWEVRTRFAGQTRPALLGQPLSTAEAAFGEPAESDDDTHLYNTRYGCLRVMTAGDEITKVATHARACTDPSIPR